MTRNLNADSAAFVFQRQTGTHVLSHAARHTLEKFYLRQLAISPMADMEVSDDPFSRVGLRFRIKPRAHRRRKPETVF